MLNLILMWCCHRNIGDKFAARDGEPSTTGVDISATTNFSTLISFTEPAFFGLLLRVRGSMHCVSGHPNTAGLGSCFVIATLAQSGAEADLHLSSVAYGLSWSICLSHFARGRLFGEKR